MDAYVVWVDRPLYYGHTGIANKKKEDIPLVMASKSRAGNFSLRTSLTLIGVRKILLISRTLLSAVSYVANGV